jgi:hypothetical protein
MTRLLDFSSRIYSRLLFFYPEDLRREFGEEMVFAFSSDLAEAWSEDQAIGAMCVWMCTLTELIRVGLPGQWENPRVAVPASAFLADMALNIACLLLGHGQASAIPANLLGGFVILGAVTALVSFAVVVFPGPSPDR